MRVLQLAELLLKVEGKAARPKRKYTHLVHMRHEFLAWCAAHSFFEQVMAAGQAWMREEVHRGDVYVPAAVSHAAFASWQADFGTSLGSTLFSAQSPTPRQATELWPPGAPTWLLPVAGESGQAVVGALGAGQDDTLPPAHVLRAAFPHGALTPSTARAKVPGAHRLGEASGLLLASVQGQLAEQEGGASGRARSGRHPDTFAPSGLASFHTLWLLGQYKDAVLGAASLLQRCCAADVPGHAVSAVRGTLLCEALHGLSVALRCGLVAPHAWDGTPDAVEAVNAALSRAQHRAPQASLTGAGAMLSQSSWAASQSQGVTRRRKSRRGFVSTLDGSDTDSTEDFSDASAVDDGEDSLLSHGTGSVSSAGAASHASDLEQSDHQPGLPLSHDADRSASPTADSELEHGGADEGLALAGADGGSVVTGKTAFTAMTGTTVSLASAVSLRKSAAAVAEWCGAPLPPVAQQTPEGEGGDAVTHCVLLQSFAACLEAPGASSPLSGSVHAAFRCNGALRSALLSTMREARLAREPLGHFCARGSPCAVAHTMASCVSRAVLGLPKAAALASLQCCQEVTCCPSHEAEASPAFVYERLALMGPACGTEAVPSALRLHALLAAGLSHAGPTRVLRTVLHAAQTMTGSHDASGLSVALEAHAAVCLTFAAAASALRQQAASQTGLRQHALEACICIVQACMSPQLWRDLPVEAVEPVLSKEGRALVRACKTRVCIIHGTQELR